MKKIIILAWMLLAMAHTAFAEQRGVFMKFHCTLQNTRLSLLRIRNVLLVNTYQFVWVYVLAIMETYHIVNSMGWT